MNSIIWKGVPSTNIEGLLICELPPITKPEMRTSQTEIDGKDGAIIEELGYSPYTKQLKIGLHGNFNVDKVIKYFTGEGEVVFSNEPDKVYHAHISDRIDYIRLLRYKQATIKFTVQPYKYKKNDYFVDTKTATASGTSIVVTDSADARARKIVVGDGSKTEGTVQIKTIGKNIFNYAKNLRESVSGLTTRLNADGSITITGKATADYTSVSHYDLSDVLVNGKKYYISQQSGGKLYVQVSAKEIATGTYTYFVAKGSFVADLSRYLYTANIQTSNLAVFGTEAVSETNFYQIEEGSVATAFEPYKESVATYDYSTNTLDTPLQMHDPTTIITNDDNANMSVEYFKRFEIFNEGYETSKPLMVLKGNGVVSVSVNGQHTFVYTFPEGENEVYIDSEKEDAYLGNVLKNRNMNGEFPVLIPATNIITWSGDIESISILPRSRWL